MFIMPAKLDRCVKKVKAKQKGKKKKYNPYAVCKSAMKKKQLKKGATIELEHTTSMKKAKEIAKEHLKENPNYYKKASVKGINKLVAVRCKKKNKK